MTRVRIVVSSEYHFVAHADAVFTDANYPYPFWRALAAVASEVVVVARVRSALPRSTWERADGPGVHFVRCPDFSGASALPWRGVALLAQALAAVRGADVVLLRAPGVVASAVHAAARALGRPYAIEVVGDPAESLVATGAALGRLAGVASRLLATQVAGAAASRFVTETTLQRRYPPRPGTFTIGASDLVLPDELFTGSPVAISERAALDVIFVGSLAQPYKGLDVLLAALARTSRPHRATIVGDGALRPSLEAQAARLGLHGRVRFVGVVPSGQPVFDLLAAADLFVLPSRTEGMPRALLEAMAVGLPCLATAVGGVPEVLAAEDHLPLDDPEALAAAIDGLAGPPARRQAMAERNRERARSFRASERDRRMGAFHDAVVAAAGARSGAAGKPRRWL